MWSHGNFYWNELMTHDVERAKKLYDATVGWSFEAMPMPNGTYWVAKMGDKSVGGLSPMSGPDFEDMPEQRMSQCRGRRCRRTHGKGNCCGRNSVQGAL
jgi:predicted enzyme related to lactoylglutathione lyase